MVCTDFWYKILGWMSKLHDGTKLHEDTFARGDKIARRYFCTSRQFCTETILHGLNIYLYFNNFFINFILLIVFYHH